MEPGRERPRRRVRVGTDLASVPVRDQPNTAHRLLATTPGLGATTHGPFRIRARRWGADLRRPWLAIRQERRPRVGLALHAVRRHRPSAVSCPFVDALRPPRAVSEPCLPSAICRVALVETATRQPQIRNEARHYNQFNLRS